MTKVLFLLSAVVMAVALAFSYMVQKSHKETRLARQDNDRKVKVDYDKLKGEANAVRALGENVTAMVGEVTQEKGRLEQSQITLKNRTNEVANTGEQVKTTHDKIGKIRDQLKDLLSGLPPGSTIENLGETLNQLKTTIANNEESAKKAEESANAKKKELDKGRAEVTSIQHQIEERHRLFQRNSLTATVIAVNNDWGFVVIDAGKNKEITADTKLLVVRGNETIGRLNIQTVDSNRTVANIVQKSMRSGLAVAPGDKVILETLYQ